MPFPVHFVINCLFISLVLDDGDHVHNKKDPIGCQIRGEQKNKVRKLLENTDPKDLQRNQLFAKHLENPSDLDAGNFHNVHSLAQLQKLSSENNCQHDKSNDPWTALVRECEAINCNEDYGENSVYMLSYIPFRAAWSTKNMSKLAYNLSSPTVKLIAGLDSTGNENILLPL